MPKLWLALNSIRKTEISLIIGWNCTKFTFGGGDRFEPSFEPSGRNGSEGYTQLLGEGGESENSRWASASPNKVAVDTDLHLKNYLYFGGCVFRCHSETNQLRQCLTKS